MRNHKYHEHTKTEEIKCPHCDHTCELVEDVTAHVKEVHGLGYKKCPSCDASFASTDSLAEHVKKAHEKVRDAKCKYCIYARGGIHQSLL
jgi:uncharacterized C2H2 Zn-finger protein